MLAFNVREIAEQVMRHIAANEDAGFLDYLMDNKPILRRAATYRLPRQEEPYCYFWSTLHAAARYGRTDIITSFIKGGAAVESQDERKRTPLWYAAAYAHVETVEVLLSMGAKVKSADLEGWTPLHVAARNGHLTVCRELLGRENGTKSVLLNQVDKAGYTPLHKAIWVEDVAVVTFLLRQPNIDVNRHSHEGHIMPLHLAVQNGNLQLVELLVKSGADINCATTTGVTPLMLACQRQQPAIVRHLLEGGANAGLATQNGWTALHMAAQTPDPAALRLLLHHRRHHDVSVDAANRTGWTAFLTAARHGRLAAMAALRTAGAKVTETTARGNTALHLAATNGSDAAMRFLLGATDDVDDEDGELDVTATNAEGQSALHVAASRGATRVMERLLDAGAPVGHPDQAGRSELHMASRHKHVPAVKLLLTRGANPLHSVSLLRASFCRKSGAAR